MKNQVFEGFVAISVNIYDFLAQNTFDHKQKNGKWEKIIFAKIEKAELWGPKNIGLRLLKFWISSKKIQIFDKFQFLQSWFVLKNGKKMSRIFFGHSFVYGQRCFVPKNYKNWPYCFGEDLNFFMYWSTKKIFVKKVFGPSWIQSPTRGEGVKKDVKCPNLKHLFTMELF